MAPPTPYVRWFEELRAEDVAQVGGKNAGRRTAKKMEEREKYAMWRRRWHSLQDQFTLTV